MIGSSKPVLKPKKLQCLSAPCYCASVAIWSLKRPYVVYSLKIDKITVFDKKPASVSFFVFLRRREVLQFFAFKFL